MEAKLVVIGGKANMGEVKLRLPMTIGRGKTADLIIAHPTVSREHCRLLEVDGALMVRDNGSSNGVYVDGKKVAKESVVRPGQTLSIGPLTFRAEYEPEADLTKYETEAKQRSLADTTTTDADEFDFLMDTGKSAQPAGKSAQPVGKPAVPAAKPAKPVAAQAPGAAEAKAKSPAAPKPGAAPTKGAAPTGKTPAEKSPVKAPVAKAPGVPADVSDTAEVDLDEFWQDEVVETPAAQKPATQKPASPSAKTPPAAPAAPAEAKQPAPAEPPKAPEPKIGPPSDAAAHTAADDFDFLAELDATATKSAAPTFEGLPHVDDVPETAAWKVDPAASPGSETTENFNFNELFADAPTATKTTDAEPAAEEPAREPVAESTAKRTEIEPDFDFATASADEVPGTVEPVLEEPAAKSDAWPAVEEPAMEEIAVEDIGVEEPAIDEPAVEEPAPVESRDVDPFDFLKKETDADQEAPRAETPAAPAAAAPKTEVEPDFDFLADEPKPDVAVEPESSTSSSPTIEMPSIDVDEVAESMPTVDIREPVAPDVAEEPLWEPVAESPAPESAPPIEAEDVKAESESPISFESESADTGSAATPAWPAVEETAAPPAVAGVKAPDFSAFSFDDDEPATQPAEEPVFDALAETPAAVGPAEAETLWSEPQEPETPSAEQKFEPAPAAEPAPAIEPAPAVEPERAVGPSADEETAGAFPDFAEESREKERAMFSFLDAPKSPAAEAPSAPQEIAAASPTAGAADELDVTSFFGDEPARSPAPAAESAAESDEVSEPAAAAEPSLPAFEAAPAAAPAAKVGAKTPAVAKPSLFEQLKMLFTGKKAKPATKKPAAPAAKPAKAKGDLPGAAAGSVIAASGFAPPPPQDAPIPPADAPIPLADEPAASEAPSSQAEESPAQPAFDSIGTTDEPKPSAATAEEFPIDFGDEPLPRVAAMETPPSAAPFEEKPADTWGAPIPLAADEPPGEPWSSVEAPETPAPETPAFETAAFETAAFETTEPTDDALAGDATPSAPPAEPSMQSASEPLPESGAPTWDDLVASTPTEPVATWEAPAAETATSEPESEPHFDGLFGGPSADVEAPAAAAPPAEDDIVAFIDEPAATAVPNTPDEQPWADAAAATGTAETAELQSSIPQSSIPQLTTPQTAAPDSFEIADDDTQPDAAVWGEPQTEASPAVASEPTWPADEPMTTAAAASVTESGATPGAPLADFGPASSPAAPERPRRPQMVDVDLRHSPSTRLLTPVALRRPYVEVPSMVPDVPAGRSFEAKSRPPAAPAEVAVAEPEVAEPAFTERPFTERANVDTVVAESRDLDVTSAWSATPAVSDMPSSDGPSGRADEPTGEPAAASDDWTVGLSDPASAESEQTVAEEPQWDAFASTPAPSDTSSAAPAQPAEPDLSFFLDDAASPKVEATAADPWSPPNTGSPTATPTAGSASSPDDDALSFLQIDTGSAPPRAETLGAGLVPSEPAPLVDFTPPTPAAPPSPAAEVRPVWDIPVAETGSAAEKPSGNDLDFGFLDLDVNDAEAVEPAKEEPAELTLDVDAGPASPVPNEAAQEVAAVDTSAADDPFYFLRKPGEKPVPAAKPAGTAPKQNEKDKDLDDFLSDLGM